MNKLIKTGQRSRTLDIATKIRSLAYRLLGHDLLIRINVSIKLPSTVDTEPLKNVCILNPLGCTLTRLKIQKEV